MGFSLIFSRERGIGDQDQGGGDGGFDLKILRKKKRKKKNPNGMGLGNFESIRLNISYGLHTYNGFYILNY